MPEKDLGHEHSQLIKNRTLTLGDVHPAATWQARSDNLSLKRCMATGPKQEADHLSAQASELHVDTYP